jgi:hypothetical protein
MQHTRGIKENEHEMLVGKPLGKRSKGKEDDNSSTRLDFMTTVTNFWVLKHLNSQQHERHSCRPIVGCIKAVEIANQLRDLGLNGNIILK